jgi:hypothetical protein
MNVEIFDDFLPIEDFKVIESSILEDAYFPWYYNKLLDEKDDYLHNFQFTHLFYTNYSPASNWYTLLFTLLKKINPSALIRIKANLIPLTNSIIEHQFHSDIKFTKCKTAIFYLNTNNGYTAFKDGTKINSIKNRLVLFDSNLEHRGTTCTDQKYRCLINLNYFK